MVGRAPARPVTACITSVSALQQNDHRHASTSWVVGRRLGVRRSELLCWPGLAYCTALYWHVLYQQQLLLLPSGRLLCCVPSPILSTVLHGDH